MGRVYSPEELAGSEVVSDAPAPAQPQPKPVKAASAPPKPAAAAPAAKRVYSPAELAGSEVVSDGDEEAPTLSQGSAALHTAAQGAQLGLTDELMGAGGAVGELAYHVLNEGRLPTGKELRDAYTSTRDEERQTVAAAHKFYPKTALASEIAGGLAVPLPGGGAANTVKAVGLGRKALAAAKALAPVAATGAVAGFGYQDSGEGNVATPAEAAEAGGEGAVAGVATGLAVKGAGKVLKAGAGAAKTPYLWLRNRLGRTPEEIKTAILDEIATAPNGKQVRDTVKKHLTKAGDAIYDEVIGGPEARTVQRAYQAKTANDGLKVLQPVIDRLDTQRTQLYGEFERAGAHVVDLPTEYVPRLTKAAQEARKEGDKHLADGLEGVAEMITGEAEKTQAAGGATSMKWLRAHQSSLQAAAASKIGGLEEHETASLARHVAEEAKGVLDDVFIAKAGKNPALQAAGEQIKSLNRRYYANLTLKDALEARAVKEGVQGGPFEAAGRKIGKVLSSTGVGGGLAGAPGAAIGAAVGGGEVLGAKAGRAIDRLRTSGGIERLRQAASGQSGVSPSTTIKQLATEYGLSEREVRAAYIRLVVGDHKPNEASAEQP